MNAVHPVDVEALRAPLQTGMAALCLTCDAELAPDVVRLVNAWRAWAAEEPTWITAPDMLEEGLALERELARLQGPKPRRYNTGPHTTGLVTPGDVMAYRDLWNDYVMGTAKAALDCATAWDAAAAALSATPPLAIPASINAAQFKQPLDASTAKLWAETERTNADAIQARWNAHANTSPADIVIGAAAILQDFQDAVLRVGQFYQQEIARDCPSLALPMPPAPSLQTELIGQYEGAGILAHGILQLLGIGADGALETLGAIGSTIQGGVKALSGPGPWIAAGLAAGVLLLLARR